MNITGRIVVFVEDKKTDKGTIKVFSTSVGRKNEDGSYTNATMGVRFTKDNFPLERLNKLQANKAYTFDLEEAWLDCRAYEKKDGKSGREIYISIKSAKPVESKEIVRKDLRANLPEDLPF